MTTSSSSHSHATTALDAAIAAETARATAAEAALAARLTALEAAPVPSPVPPPSGTAFLGYPVSGAVGVSSSASWMTATSTTGWSPE